MSVSPPPSTQNPNVVITVGAGNTISYAIDGAQPVPSCKLTDLTSNGGLYASFSLDAPSTKAGWSMTECRSRRPVLHW